MQRPHGKGEDTGPQKCRGEGQEDEEDAEAERGEDDKSERELDSGIGQAHQPGVRPFTSMPASRS